MKKFTFALFVLVLASLVLAACSAGLDQTPAASQDIAAATSAATQTPYVVVVTATPLPATETPVPTATATFVTTATESTTPITSNDNNIVVNGTILGVVDPQMQETHAAALYLPTGISGHNVWEIKIPSNGVLIVGGTDVNGISGGVYQAWAGGQTVSVDVTNGFALVTLDKWGQWEFCFRVSQAVQYGWAHGTVTGLSNWASCQ